MLSFIFLIQNPCCSETELLYVTYLYIMSCQAFVLDEAHLYLTGHYRQNSLG